MDETGESATAHSGDSRLQQNQGNYQRGFSILHDGSISATGFFAGLDCDQAHRSFYLLHEEYRRFITQLGGQPSRHCCTGNLGVDQLDADSGVEHGSPEPVEVQPPEDPEQKAYRELEVFWGKRNWGRNFDLFNSYDGQTSRSFQVWNKLLEWLWASLSKEHMNHLLAILIRVWKNETSIPDITDAQDTGRPRSVLQQALIRSYYRVVRADYTQDVCVIAQRFYLVRMCKSHIAYVEEYRRKGMALQTAQERVNQHLYQVFNDELSTAVSLQTIKNHLKDGRHWAEILHTRQTAAFGYGLLLLLPVRGFSDLARKTANSVWQFLLPRIPSISRRIVEVAQALDPIAKAIHNKGIGNVDVPLIGYELHQATNLHDLLRPQFKTGLGSYPNLDIQPALTVIETKHRTSDPDRIVSLVQGAVVEETTDNDSGILCQAPYQRL